MVKKFSNWFYFVIVVLCFLTPAFAWAEECIIITSPVENTVVIGKRPEIKGVFRCPLTPGSYVVMLDGVDITQLMDVTAEGFTYRPETLVTTGSHSLSVSYTGADNLPHQFAVNFSIRHSEKFGEIYSKNDVSLLYEGALVRKDSTADAAVPVYTEGQNVAPSTTAAYPSSKIEGNLASESRVKEGPWNVSLTTNVRYFDQDIPVTDPLKKGFNVANWLFTGNYEKDRVKMKLSAGDIMINETPYTIAGFSRKGTMFNGEAGPVYANVFSARSAQTYGVDGGIGIGNVNEDHIFGASAGVKLFENKVDVRTIYVTGTDPSASGLPASITPPSTQSNVYGNSTTTGNKQGDVVGFLLTTDFLQNRLRTEMEADFTRYDPDNSDEFEKRSSSAYRAKIGGAVNWFTYDALYEYIGKYYGVIGNPSLAKDRQGFSLQSGINLSDQNLSVMASRYSDNVESDPLFPEIVSTQGNVSYQFNKIPYVPLGFTYQKILQESSKEPVGGTRIDTSTDTYSGRIGFTKGSFSVNFSPSYSIINDKTPADADTTNIVYAAMAAYALPNLSIAPAFTWSKTRNHATNVWTDTFVYNLDFRSRFFHDRISFDTGGTYTASTADNNSVDSGTWNARATLAYRLNDHLKTFVKPTVGLRFSYLKTDDKINVAMNKDEFSLFVVLEAAIPVIF
ncbi:MAG TPA: hypothetical protein DDX93_00125 [Smithella sp.]|jgi:hypothetical protein|nr:hypothetical protein [Smithella sp.]